MRLIRYIQTNFQISRRQVTKLIDEKKIMVNKEIVESYVKEVEINDMLSFSFQNKKYKKIVKFSVDKKAKILLFNKPKWYVVSKSDPFNKTIYELLPSKFQSFYYIWRLDKDSHWLILLTNEPKLVDQFEHPRNEIKKIYIVKLDKPLEKSDQKQVLEWIYDDWDFLPVKSCLVTKWELDKITVVLTEWKKRHIRRIFNYLWYKIIDLKRVQEGKYNIGNIKTGEWELIDISTLWK